MVGSPGPTVSDPQQSGNKASNEDVADVLEERLIDAEYKIWKKNTPYLYDFVMTHSLEWPSLTCQWLPQVRNAGAHSAEHSLLLGTHTTGEQNYLMVAGCNIPKDDQVVEEDKASKQSVHQYDEEKKELGGFGHANSNVGKIEIRMKVQHEGEVNRARYMPQNPFVVATRGPNPEIYIFDLSKHPSFPEENSAFSPQGVCVGHTKEGYGMVWSKHQKGHLLTASEDKSLALWDVSAVPEKGATAGTQIKPLSRFQGIHKAVVEDVDWHHKDAHMIASVGDDRFLCLWDVRDTKTPQHIVEKAHDGDINCVAFNPQNEYVLATGGADKVVALWDLRNLKTPTHLLQGHTEEVYMLDWAPFNETILGSCSADRRVATWDLSRIGMEQSAEDAEDGPPELLFLHGGHTSKVSDFAWNAKDEWTIASVSEDNVLQVWNMAEEIYAPEDEEEMKSTGSGEDKMLGDDELE